MNGFSIAFEIVGGVSDSTNPKASKPKVERYRVTRKNYYNPANPVHPQGKHQCVRCNEILGARITTLYAAVDGSFTSEPNLISHPHAVKMGVFCAISALENDERLYVAVAAEVA